MICSKENSDKLHFLTGRLSRSSDRPYGGHDSSRAELARVACSPFDCFRTILW